MAREHARCLYTYSLHDEQDGPGGQRQRFVRRTSCLRFVVGENLSLIHREYFNILVIN